MATNGSGQYPAVTGTTMKDGASLSAHITSNQSVDNIKKTTASMSGGPANTVSTYTYSDIMQGVGSTRDPADLLLVVNKSLSGQLDAIYGQGFSDLSTFSTTIPTSLPDANAADPPLVGPADGTDGPQGFSGGGSTGGTAGQVKKEWVQQLSLEGTNGALIWAREGKASIEMHLPTHGGAPTSEDGHRQNPGLPEGQKYPYYMDRVGGWIGGEDYIAPTPSPNTTIGNENAATAGAPGAYAGYYKENGGYMTPQDEQWYCSMGWPFTGSVEGFNKAGLPDIAEKARNIKHSAYSKKKILVYSVDTQRACVCTPGDWGPHPHHSTGNGMASIDGFIIGLNPDVHFVLGTTHGSRMMLGFMPDNTSVGPYKPTLSQALPGSSITPPASGFRGGGGDIGASTGVLTREQTVEALTGQGNNIRLAPVALEGWNAWRAAWDGPIPCTSGWRDPDQQQAAYLKEPGRFAPAASSYHCKGLAVDVNMDWLGALSASEQSQFRIAARETGWGQPRWRKVEGPVPGYEAPCNPQKGTKTDEPWHFSWGGCG